MANQHPPYSHPGPSYYPHSPPPHPYGFPPNPNAVPFYPYPPPMNGHSPLHQPTSPRLHGGGRDGYPSHRPGPNFQHFQPIPPQHYMPPQPITPLAVSPTSPYSQAQKYSPHAPQMSYSPSYPPQHNGPYPPQTWPAQPLSPLPKQLSMLPPPQSHPQEVPVPPPSLAPPQPLPSSASAPVASLSSFVQPSVIPSASSSVSTSPQVHSSSQAEPTFHEHLSASATTSEASSVPSTPASRPKASEISISGWVIWSRRGNPSDAPGVIISPRANPPEHVVQKALQLPSPPVSPKIKLKSLQRVAVLSPHEVHVPLKEEVKEEPAKEESPEPADVPSSSATETTPACSTAPDTPVPGSPLSTNTSISLATGSPAVGKPLKPLASPEAHMESTAVELPSTVAPSATEISAREKAQSVVSPPTQPVTSPSVPATPPPATTPQAAPPKKSWASLLQSSDTASSSKSRLPTSSIVGFSIPATLTASTSAANGAPVQARPELLSLLTTGPKGSIPPPKIRPRGIINTGNMCFANAVLQVLVYCPPFHRLFTELGKHITGPIVGPQKDGSKATPLVEAIIQFLREFNPRSVDSGTGGKGKEREEDDFYDLDSFVPNYVYDVMKEKKRFASMVGGYQEDAEEFLGFFLDILEEELFSLQSSLSPTKAPASVAGGNVGEHAETAAQDDKWFEVGKRNRTVVTRTVKSMDSPITRIFGGKFRSTLRAPHQKDSVTIEDWRALRLDISRDQVHTIKDALQLISHPQSVQLTSPTRPGQVIEATQHTLIESLPPVLVLHMKRFMYDTTVGDVVKINKQVAYGFDLEIGPDLIAPTKRTSHPIKYQLFAVLYHHGQSASGGHYTLDVLHPNRDMNDRPRAAWIRIDDELVSDIRADDVFGTQERDDRCAYLLFYRRVGNVASGPRTWSSLAAAHNAV
ncbi:unnamed protein product [Somion occarium]|uniref:Ubiquitin carboxyl-terminal hydrolase n=1 Tax=Somion occarium TaxID=3059160 RepID=A0ABP1DDV2_9APHY